jgi:hypothetical protein
MATTLDMTVNWLTAKHPVVFTGIGANAHKMAHPHALFQDCIDDNLGWWLDVHEPPYTPEHGKRAGVKAPPFNHWRDHVLLPALRLYRARLEGLPLASVPPVAYSLKRDGGIRSIRGFVFRTRPMPDSTDEVRCGDKYGPPRPLPADLHVCKPEDSQDQTCLDKMYSDALEPLLEEPATTGTTTPTGPEEEPIGSAKRKEGRAYLCSKCKVPKKGHTCAPAEHSTSARRAKRARGE